jgi:hypothetical protein
MWMRNNAIKNLKVWKDLNDTQSKKESEFTYIKVNM